jgi:hypothetical protein
MSQAWSYHRAKTFLMEDVIVPELLSDNSANVPEDIFSDSESDSDDSMSERKIVRPRQSYSENQTGSEESNNSNDTSNVGATTWVKEGKTPNLGPFTGNPEGEMNSLSPNRSVRNNRTLFRRQLLCNVTQGD